MRYAKEARDTDREPLERPSGASHGSGGAECDGKGSGREPAAGGGRPETARRGFPAEVDRFLGVLSHAVQQHSMYPPGHPALGTVVGAVMDAVEPLLANRAVFSVGVASRQLTAEGVESRPEHPRLSFLASRLHRHRLSSISVESGVSPGEIAEFLARVGREPELGEPALGRPEDGELPGWPHLRVQPIRYDHLRLARDGGETLDDPEDGAGRSSRLSLGLARAALMSEASDVDRRREALAGATDEQEVAAVACAVERYASERMYAEEVLSHVVSITRELRAAEGAEAEALRRRTSRLVALVPPDTLRDVLRAGGDAEERRQLLLDACRWMEPASVVKLVRATAGVDRRDISHWLLLMMSKLAQHASSGDGRLRTEAEASLRDQVARLVDDWALEDAVPDDYGKMLERLSGNGTRSRDAGDEPDRRFVEGEPERVLMMGLEVDLAGPVVVDAAAELIHSGRTAAMLEILDRAPDGSRSAGEIFDRVIDPGLVRRVLTEPEPDFDTLDRLVARLGIQAARPMLDALAESEDRAVRRRLFSRIAGLGYGVAPLVAKAMDRHPRWYVKRNMLALMAEFDRWPKKWSPAAYAEHPHSAVRREALKLMLREEELRDGAISGLLEDRDPRALALGLAAAQEGAPPDAVTLLLNLAEDPSLRGDLRRSAIRTLVSCRSREARPLLLRLCQRPTAWPLRIFGVRKLAEKSPLLLEALAGLHRAWRSDPRAKRILSRAARSSDAEVRAAARGELEPGGGP